MRSPSETTAASAVTLQRGVDARGALGLALAAPPAVRAVAKSAAVSTRLTSLQPAIVVSLRSGTPARTSPLRGEA